MIKVQLKLGFNCVPDFIVRHYEVKEGDRINEVVIDYDIDSIYPYWDAYVIIERDIAPEKIKKWIRRLYESIKFLLNNAKDTFEEKVDAFNIPDEDKLNKILCNDFHVRGEGVSIKQKELFNTVKERALIDVESLMNENNVDTDKWRTYIENVDIDNMIMMIIKRLTILNMHDGYVDFKISNNYVKTLESISIKLANNLFYEFKKLHGDDKDEQQQ